MDERLAYSNGFGTGFSSGYASAISWMNPQRKWGCRIESSSFVERPSDLEQNIYAIDWWIDHHIRLHQAQPNETATTHIFVPSSHRRKSQFIRKHPEKIVIVNDFGPFCRFQKLGGFPNVRFIMMSPGNGGCRNDERDIVAPHTVLASQPIATHDEPAKYDAFFYGHLSKPYIQPPISQLRYRIFSVLHDLPHSMIGAYNVEENANALTSTDFEKVCRTCSYSCKLCYFAKQKPTFRNAKRLSATDFRTSMRNSNFCVVARGDNPGCPKLAEAIVNHCIPIIVMDQKLPFEDELNYTAFSFKLDPWRVLKNPRMVRDIVERTPLQAILRMKQQLAMVSDMFSVRTGGSAFTMQSRLVHEMCRII